MAAKKKVQQGEVAIELHEPRESTANLVENKIARAKLGDAPYLPDDLKRPDVATAIEPIAPAEDWNPKLSDIQRKMLMWFVETGAVPQAARLAGITPRQHYDWLRKNEVYAAEFKDAERMAADALLVVARERARAGSDTLIIFLLKGLIPDTFGDRIKVQKQLEQLSDEELQKIIADGRALAGSGSNGEGGAGPSSGTS